MNWHRHPELLDRLAAEYALGTLKGGARRRFESVMRTQPEVARAAARWATRLEPLDARLPEVPAGEALWSRIEHQAFGEARTASTRPATEHSTRTPGTTGRGAATAASWWQRWFGPAPAAALAFGLALGVGLPVVQQALQGEAQTQLPESYVGVLATADGRPGLIVSSLRHGRTVDFKVVQRVAVPEGSVPFLWTLDAKGVPQAVGPLPALAGGGSFVSIDLGRSAEQIFARAVELAVSLEAAGSSPAAPSAPYVYRGLCGKLWPVPPAASAAPRSPTP